MATALDLDIVAFWGFSSQYGTAALFEAVLELIERRRIETVIAVDVGGDILSTDRDRPTVLTPIVDFSCMDLVRALHGRVRTMIAVIDPGICGEVTADSLRTTIDDLAGRNALIDGRPTQCATRPVDVPLR